MFDLVPFACARREMTHFDLQAKPVAQSLEFHLPEAAPSAVAASAVRRDQKSLGCGITATPQSCPPASNRLDGEFGGVTADTDADPRLIFGEIVDPIRDSLPFLWIGKVVRLDFDRLSLPTPS